MMHYLSRIRFIEKKSQLPISQFSKGNRCIKRTKKKRYVEQEIFCILFLLCCSKDKDGITYT